ncbi:MAG: sulfatase-like hydrolase/transferase [Desulfomonile tiedjei]|nr:sulfatase-like hydrolase/transferase [Desulfomonile tiedjei]
MPSDKRTRSDADTTPTSGAIRGSETPAKRWLGVLLFLTTSSALFACLFEWDRYHIIMGPRAESLALMDEGLIFWLLAAKSLAWCIPVILLVGVLFVQGFERTGVVILNASAVLIFYFFATDIISVSFSGYHLLDWFPHLRDILQSPGQKIWQWAGDGFSGEAGMLFLMFAAAGPAVFFATRWVTRKLVTRFVRLGSKRTQSLATAALVCGIVGVVPAMGLFQDQNLLDRVYAALPPQTSFGERFQGVAEVVAEGLGIADTTGMIANLSTISNPAAGRVAERQVPSVKDIREHVDLKGGIRPEAEYPERTDSDDQIGMPDQDDEMTAIRVASEAVDPKPADPAAFVRKPNLPNIVLIIFESFRHFAIGPKLMPQLDAWSNEGLRLERHYSGSNCSHLGLFSLFYGRAALGYDQTLQRNIPPQMFESLRRSGYHITCVTSGETKGFRRLDKFINDRYCHDMIFEGAFGLNGMKDWPDSDSRKLARVRSILNTPQKKPQFVFFYLLSSHYRYPFPPEFDVHPESATFWQFLNPREQMRNHLNRYANSLLFLQHEVMKFLQSINLDRNLILITGDHGESMGEDGVFTHASRMSDIQMRVPFVMVGPGVKPRKISTATSHMDVLPTLLHALAGKSVPIKNCQGRDLIADPAPEDKVALVPANGANWDGMVIIRGNNRLAYRTTTAPGETPSAQFSGQLDEAGNYAFKVRRVPRTSGNGR